jgi:hypothetical protein
MIGPGRAWQRWCVGLLAASAGQAAEPSVALGRMLYLPPAFEATLCFYHSFEMGWTKPDFNPRDLKIRGGALPSVPGIAGRGGRCSGPEVGGGPLTVTGDALSPVRPLTVMLWWRLDAPMREETGYDLLSLRGDRGLVASFVRGKGQWCALPEPRRVFQVYYFPGITDRNDICSERLWPAPGVWHHTAISIRGASEIEVFWDGRRVTHCSIKGRRFGAADISHAVFGGHAEAHPMSIDELMILARALSEDEIAAYVSAVRALSCRGLPAVSPAP